MLVFPPPASFPQAEALEAHGGVYSMFPSPTKPGQDHLRMEEFYVRGERAEATWYR